MKNNRLVVRHRQVGHPNEAINTASKDEFKGVNEISRLNTITGQTRIV